MDNMNPTASVQAVQPTAPQPAAPVAPAKAKEHWMVEVAGGTTLGATIMAGLALWTLTTLQIFT